MAYDVTALPNYTEQNRSDLMVAAVLAAKSTGLFTKQSGVVGPTTINLLDLGVAFQNGADCGFNASGNDTFSQRTITPGIVKVNKSFCPKALRTKYLAHEVEVGAGRETMPFEEKFTSGIVAKIGAELEKAIWQGNSTSGTGNLAFFNGLVTLMAADITNTVIPAANVITAGSSDSIYKRVKDVYKKIAVRAPETMADSVIMLNYANFTALVMDLMEQNLFHYKNDVDNSMEIVLPGTSTKVVAIPGLAGVDQVIAMPPEEVVYGFDNEGDESAFDLWFSKDNQEFRLNVCFSAGVQYAFPQHIIVGKPYGA